MESKKSSKLLILSTLVSLFFVATSFIFYKGKEFSSPRLKEDGAVIKYPINWSELEKKLVAYGVIDPYRFKDGMRSDLNLLWAFGLSNENRILSEGPMNDPRYGGVENFASTGGWTMAKGDVMDHYNKHSFVVLSSDEQSLVERVSKDIYRPCCKNPAYFPDCNHGMAMLGFLEILAVNGLDEASMRRLAKETNERWFPQLDSNNSGNCSA